VDAVIVSNHGGRQLDGAVSAIQALPAVVEAVQGRAEVILDGGVRRGSDVVKAICHGARACMVGRAWLYGLAAGGEAGVGHALGLLRAEMERAMTLLGAAAAGLDPYDSVYTNFRDEAGLRAECEAGRRDGFVAKMAIHPAQVPVINEAFTPSAATIARARAILAAFADNPGLGVVGIDGEMIDLPHVKRAERLLARLDLVRSAHLNDRTVPPA
jgi:citrate lyase beta subunit